MRESRSITIYCDNRFHEGVEPDLCALVSSWIADLEIWSPDDRVELQRLAPSDSAYAIDMMNTQLAPAEVEQFRVDVITSLTSGASLPYALRFTIQCECGRRFTVGDLLAKGYASVLIERAAMSEMLTARHEHRYQPFPDNAVMSEKQWTNYQRLSAWADSGESRLSLSRLRRILKLPQ